jgi:hypothetical protein
MLFSPDTAAGKRIRPLRGIRRNTIMKKFRMKTGKIFNED